MTLRPPIYPSDFVPAPRDWRPGESEAERTDRLLDESEERLRAHIARFPPEGERVPCACPPAGPIGPQEIANGRQ